MEKYKPKYYVETRFEKTIKFREGDIRHYHFEQPVEYCNGICLWDYPEDSFERKNWANFSRDCSWYNEVLRVSRYNDKVWTNKQAMDSAFEVIFNTKSEGDGVYTPIKDFEVWLMCKGYEMIGFDKMCAQQPCFGLVADSKSSNTYTNVRGTYYSRFYTNKQTGKTFFFAFGIENRYLKFNFYFTCNANNLTYQTPVKIEDFIAAEELQLQSFEEISFNKRKEYEQENLVAE